MSCQIGMQAEMREAMVDARTSAQARTDVYVCSGTGPGLALAGCCGQSS